MGRSASILDQVDTSYGSCLGEVEVLRAEYANLRAGLRHRADFPEHRMEKTERKTANTAEYGGIQLNACPLERY